MKISIVIPTYQRPELLLRCVNAVASQLMDAADYEIIVVSDGPDEKTHSLIRTFSETHSHLLIQNLSTETKGGPAAARNKGWMSGAGELIAFTDDDCIPDKNWLASFWTAYSDHRVAAIAFTGKTTVPISSRPSDYELNISHLATAEFITANCAVTRKALEHVNGFDERFTTAWREDSDLHFKFILAGIPVIRVDSAHVTHPVRKHKWAISLMDEKKGVFNVLLYKKYPALYREKIEPNVPVNYYLICLSLLLVIYGAMLEIKILTITGLVLWVTLTSAFVLKRLKYTRRTFCHIMEMIVTSIGIPWLSLYYRWKGSLKYRALLW
jgi:glycosyltransferase involved in cell wall biosynthesis